MSTTSGGYLVYSCTPTAQAEAALRQSSKQRDGSSDFASDAFEHRLLLKGDDTYGKGVSADKLSQVDVVCRESVDTGYVKGRATAHPVHASVW